jgi:CheY-like chemotaxis protein
MGEETGGASDREFKLLGDHPHVGLDDPLGFDRAAEDLAALILDSRRSTPFTLGIEATWGMGKSSLMGALQSRLEDESSVSSIQFNAWTAEEGKVLEAFVKTVLEKIGPRVLSFALHRQKAIGVLRVPVSIVASKLGLSSVVDTAWEKLAADPSGRNELRQLVDKAIRGWRRQRSRSGDDRLLCVFVDDLDRCSPKVVLEVLEAMKLYLDVPGMVFVVGFDEDIVSEVVLRDKGYAEKMKARGYLEKFIQISYRIPQPEDEQAEVLIRSMLEASGTAGLLGENERRLVVDGSGSNPRRIKRFINSFVLLYGLEPLWRKLKPEGLVRALLVRMYFPEFARLLERPGARDPVEEFLEYEGARKTLRREVLSVSDHEVVDRALARHDLPSSKKISEEPKEILRLLEERVPVEFPGLAERQEFVDLVRSLSSERNWLELRRAFSRGALAQVDSPESEGSFWGRTGFAGRRVIWIDDEMQVNGDLVAILRKGGAYVVTVENEEQLVSEMSEEEFTVLISDITRGDDYEAGFQALRALREHPQVERPERIVFFTSRVTPERVETATELGAKITSDPKALLNFVAATPADER